MTLSHGKGSCGAGLQVVIDGASAWADDEVEECLVLPELPPSLLSWITSLIVKLLNGSSSDVVLVLLALLVLLLLLLLLIFLLRRLPSFDDGLSEL